MAQAHKKLPLVPREEASPPPLVCHSRGDLHLQVVCSTLNVCPYIAPPGTGKCLLTESATSKTPANPRERLSSSFQVKKWEIFPVSPSPKLTSHGHLRLFLSATCSVPLFKHSLSLVWTEVWPLPGTVFFKEKLLHTYLKASNPLPENTSFCISQLSSAVKRSDKHSFESVWLEND